MKTTSVQYITLKYSNGMLHHYCQRSDGVILQCMGEKTTAAWETAAPTLQTAGIDGILSMYLTGMNKGWTLLSHTIDGVEVANPQKETPKPKLICRCDLKGANCWLGCRCGAFAQEKKGA
jgi:hypothetical protein